MTYYFGFVPSTTLKDKTNALAELVNNGSSELYYPLRNDITYLFADEIIDTVLVGMLAHLQGDRKEALDKTISTLKTVLHALLKQALSKGDNKEVRDSSQFLADHRHLDNEHVFRLGAIMPTEFAQSFKQTLAEVASYEGNEIPSQLVTKMAQELQILVKHILDELLVNFSKSLNLGMIKRKIADVASSQMSSILSNMISKMIPKSKSSELLLIAQHYNKLVYQGTAI